MCRALILAALLLPLAGCYAPPGAYGYGYAQPGYQPDPYADQQDVYGGYDYNGGSPYMTYEGAQVPLIFFGGSWGFYDRDRHFHRAPEGVERHLQSRHPEGAGARPYGGPPAGSPWNGYPAAPRPQYHPNANAPAYAAPPPRVAAPAAPAAQPRREEHPKQNCPWGQAHC